MAAEGSEVDLPRHAVVIRFRPTEPESVLAAANKAVRHYGRAGVSVFADIPGPRETRDDVVRRLLDAAQLSGLDPARNRNVFICAEAGELLDLKFVFYKDEDDDELPEHFSVDLGPDPNVTDAERFLSAFQDQRRWTT